MLKKLALLLLCSSFSFAADSIKVIFTLGKPLWHDGKNSIAVQPNQSLNEKGSLYLPKGSIITLEINGQKIRIKGENQFKIKDLIDNIGQFEKFLDNSSKRKEMSGKMLLKLQPATQMGVRASEEKTNPDLKWADDTDEKQNLDKDKTTEKIKNLYLKGEYEGVLNLLKEHPGLVNQIKTSETIYYLGASYFFLGGYENAVEYFEKSLLESGLNASLRPACLYMNALSYEALGNYKKTAETIELFLTRHGSSASEPEVYLLLAKAYSALGNKKKKDEILNKIEEKFSTQQIDSAVREEIRNLKEAK